MGMKKKFDNMLIGNIKNYATSVKNTTTRISKKTADSAHVFFKQKRLSQTAINHIIEKRADKVTKIIQKESNLNTIYKQYEVDIYVNKKQNINIQDKGEYLADNISPQDVISDAFISLTQVKKNTHAEYVHDKEGMRAFRKIAKQAIANKSISLNTELAEFIDTDSSKIRSKLRFLSRKINANNYAKVSANGLKIAIEFIDTEKLTPTQSKKLDELKIKISKKTFSYKTSDKKISNYLLFLDSLPSLNKVQINNLIAITKNAEQLNLKHTPKLVKVFEIIHSDAKEERHAMQFDEFQTMITDLTNNLDNQENLSRLFAMINMPAFKYAVMSNPNLGIAIKYLLKNDPKAENSMYEFESSYANRKYIKQGFCNSADQNKKDAIHGYLFITNQDNYSKNLANGTKEHYKNVKKSMLKRLLAKGLAPALYLGLLAVATEIMIPANVIKSAPAIAASFGALFSLIKSNKDLKKYSEQEPIDLNKKDSLFANKDKIDIKNKLKKTLDKANIIVSNAIVPIFTCTTVAAASVGIRIGLIAGLGNHVAAGVISAASLATAVIAPTVSYAIATKELQQNIISSFDTQT